MANALTGWREAAQSADYARAATLHKRLLELSSADVLRRLKGAIHDRDLATLTFLAVESTLLLDPSSLDSIVGMCVREGFDEGVMYLCDETQFVHVLNLQGNRFGETPSHAAARFLQMQALSALVAHAGFDSRATDRGGKTVLHLLLLRLQTRWGQCRRLSRPLEPSPRAALTSASSISG